jgi:hypothetical protein
LKLFFNPIVGFGTNRCQGHTRTQEYAFISKGNTREIPITLPETCLALVPITVHKVVVNKL